MCLGVCSSATTTCLGIYHQSQRSLTLWDYFWIIALTGGVTIYLDLEHCSSSVMQIVIDITHPFRYTNWAWMITGGRICLKFLAWYCFHRLHPNRHCCLLSLVMLVKLPPIATTQLSIVGLLRYLWFDGLGENVPGCWTSFVQCLSCISWLSPSASLYVSTKLGRLPVGFSREVSSLSCPLGPNRHCCWCWLCLWNYHRSQPSLAL